MAEINPDFPALGDKEWGPPLLDGLSEIVNEVNSLDDTVSTLPENYIPRPSGGTAGQALVLNSDGSTGWGTVASGGSGTTSILAQSSGGTYPTRPVTSNTMIWIGTTPPADGLMATGDLFFWVAT